MRAAVVVEADPVTDDTGRVLDAFEAMPVSALLFQRPTRGCRPRSPPSFRAKRKAKSTTYSRGITPSRCDRGTAYEEITLPP
jgi:hypothetical protein